MKEGRNEERKKGRIRGKKERKVRK